MTAFSDTLKRLMEAKRLKQIDLVKALGVSKQVVSNWFTRGFSPDISHLPAIAKMLGITLDDFFREMDGEVKQSETFPERAEKTHEGLPLSVALDMQKKINDLQEQLIQYQKRELENQHREIERQRSLSPDQDATTSTSKLK